MKVQGFLSTLDAPAAAALKARLVERSVAPGHTMITHDAVENRVFVMLSGQALVTIYSSEGKAVSYRTIEAGDIFGELAAIDRAPRSASVVAQTACRVGEISGPAFLALLREEPDLALAVLAHLTRQIRALTTRILEFSTLKVKDRLVLELLRIAARGEEEKGALVARPAPTHFELAARISTHREAVSREMSRLSKLGLVKKAGDALVFGPLDALRAELDD